jgi:hypothetical protein
MKLSWGWAFGLAVVVSIAGATGAGAANAPRGVHHAKAAEPHLSEGHRAGGRHAAARPAASSKTAHASAAHSKGTHAARTRAAEDAAPVLTARGRGRASLRRASLRTRRHGPFERFTASSFASGDIFAGDVTAGEDPVVRQAAIAALGDMNGTAVVINPSNGRILAMVNQKLALSPGAEPCSTIKITVAMAALSEGLVNRDTMVKLPGFRMNMTQALAKSNNLYFEQQPVL